MADHGLRGETILQRSDLLQVKNSNTRNSNTRTFHILILTSEATNLMLSTSLKQEELNSSDCGWALLVTESDPQVLSCLLWTWLEKLRVSAEFFQIDGASLTLANMFLFVLSLIPLHP